MPKYPQTSDPCVAKIKKNQRICPVLPFLLALLLLLSACSRAEPQREPPTPQKSLTVYLDPGHGDFDFGAVGATADGREVAEKDIALSVALLMADALREAGHTVILSRENDSRLTYTNSRDEILARRAAAVEAGADLLLSVHVNAYRGEGRAFGPRVYYHPENREAAARAESLAAAVTEHTGALVGRDCRTVADGSYLILENQALPALIFEIGFITDEDELALLLDPAYGQRLADALSDSLA